MIDVLRIAPQEGNLEVGNCEGNQYIGSIIGEVWVEFRSALFHLLSTSFSLPAIFFLETFFCYFTLRYADYDGSLGASINYFYAVIFGILVYVFPFAAAGFYIKNFKTIVERK